MLGFLHVCMYILQSKMTNVDRHCQAIIPVIFNTHPPSQPNVKSTPVQSSHRTHISPTGLVCSHWYMVGSLYCRLVHPNNVCRQEPARLDWILNSQWGVNQTHEWTELSPRFQCNSKCKSRKTFSEWVRVTITSCRQAVLPRTSGVRLDELFVGDSLWDMVLQGLNQVSGVLLWIQDNPSFWRIVVTDFSELMYFAPCGWWDLWVGR